MSQVTPASSRTRTPAPVLLFRCRVALGLALGGVDSDLMAVTKVATSLMTVLARVRRVRRVATSHLSVVARARARVAGMVARARARARVRRMAAFDGGSQKLSS